MNTSAEQRQVTFLYIANPLMPTESRIGLSMEHVPTKPLSEYLGELEGEWAISVSGRLVVASERSQTYLCPNDCVVVAPILEGGGGGSKQILRIVSVIALSIAAPALGAAWAGAGTWGAAAITAGIMIGGTMAINSLLPPAQPKVPDSGQDFDSSPTYGVDGPKNLSTRGIPVPVIYGECWFAGNYIQSYVDNVGDDQYLNLLMNMGEGPIEGISDIHVNSQPLENFTGVEVFVRTGEANQSVIPYFSDIITPNNRQVELNQNVYMTHDLLEPADRVRVDVMMPRGIGRVDDEDGFKSYTAVFTAEIREAGGAWGPLIEGASGISIGITGKQMSQIRRSYYSAQLDRTKQYELRFQHTQNTDDNNLQNQITVTDINSITYDDITYKYTALLGLRIKMSEQLSGIPTVIAKVKGRKVPVYDVVTGDYVETWTDNPAWHALDVLMNKRYGGQVNVSRIKLDYFRRWAKFCTDNGLTFNGAVDQRTNLWDALAPICKLGRGQIVRAGTRFQVSLVAQQAPTQLFTVGNIKQDSMNIEWMRLDERANEVHVTFYNRDDYGKAKTVVVENPAARERGEESQPTELTLYGCDNVDQATREGTLAMNMQALLRTITFEAPLEAIACTLGDVVAVQHDMPRWGNGGMVSAGSTTGLLKIDRPVEIEDGSTHVVMVRHDQVVQGTFEVDTVVGNIAFLGFGFNVANYSRFRRLKNIGTGYDHTIYESVIDQYGRHGVRLDTTAGLAAGTTVQLIDTDVIETRNVVGFVGQATELTPTSAFSTAPRADTPWAFGPSETVVTLMTVQNISGRGDLWRTLSGVEYMDEAYSDTVVDYKTVPINTTPIIQNVNFEGFQEYRYLQGAVYVSDVEMRWNHDSVSYAYAEVHISIDGEPWRLVDANASVATVNVSSGELRVKLVPVTVDGFKPNFDVVDIHTYTVEPGVPRQPNMVSDVRAGTVTSDIVEILWGSIDSWAASQNIYKYQIWHAAGQDADIGAAEMIAVTGNDHYPHLGLEPESWHTYWIRVVNVLADGVYSDFSPANGLSVQTLAAGLQAEVTLTDLNEQLRQSIENPYQLEELAATVANVRAKLEELTDDNVTEVFNREQADGQLDAKVNSEIATRIQEGEALASRVTNLEVSVSPATQAAIEQIEIAMADADSALALRIDNLEVSMSDEISAQVEQERIARVTETSALAQDVLTMNSTLDGHSTSIQQISSTVDGISGSWTLRIDNNGIISGFGLATGEGGVSEFAIMATKFRVVAPGPTGDPVIQSVFSVDTTTGNVTLRNAIVGNLQSDNYISGVSGWALKK